MKKLITTLLAAALLSAMVIVLKKNVLHAAKPTTTKKSVAIPSQDVLLVVVFEMNDPGGKVGGRMRRLMSARFRHWQKNSPMGSWLRALAFLIMKQKEIVATKKISRFHDIRNKSF